MSEHRLSAPSTQPRPISAWQTRVLAAAMVFGVLHAGPAPAAPDASPPPTALRAGVFTDFPPIAFKDADAIRGLEPDFATHLSQALGVPVTLVDLPWNDLIPALQAGRIDIIMAGMSITDERAKVIAFASPYLQIGQMALIRRAEYVRLGDPSAMDQASSRVGFQSNTTGAAYVQAQLKQAKLTGYATPEAGITALRANEIDFFVHDAPTIWRATDRRRTPQPDVTGLYRPLTEEYLAWAVRMDDAALRERLNGVLARWKNNGELDAILDHWITVRKVAVEVRPAE